MVPPTEIPTSIASWHPALECFRGMPEYKLTKKFLLLLLKKIRLLISTNCSFNLIIKIFSEFAFLQCASGLICLRFFVKMKNKDINNCLIRNPFAFQSGRSKLLKEFVLVFQGWEQFFLMRALKIILIFALLNYAIMTAIQAPYFALSVFFIQICFFHLIIFYLKYLFCSNYAF